MTTWDVIVIGGGIAGVSAAARIAADARVLVLEREPSVGYHTTGRSAAMLLDTYGNAAIRALTARGRPFFEDPDPEFWPFPLINRRGELLVARPGEEEALDANVADAAGTERISPADALGLVPILRREAISAACHDPRAMDIDVDLLLQGFVRLLRRSGGELRISVAVADVVRCGGLWRIETADGGVAAPILVNAAGAWGDVVAEAAGVRRVGLRPLRRSAAIVPLPAECDTAAWPLFGGVTEDWYARPMGGKLMVSPADEDPVDPHDAWADDMVLAEGLDRYERMVTIPVARVERSWAGLRSFTADRTPVAGFDPRAEGFFWLVGQGGYGIQTAPGLSELAADLVAGRTSALSPAVVEELSPRRLAGC